MTQKNKSPLQNKVILVTGGTGSWGTQFVETALQFHNPQQIRILSRHEQLQVEMERRFPKCTYLIGDVRDLERLKLATAGCDIVIHAAALKQVPKCEYDPFECLASNVYGSQNVILAALYNRVEKVIAISTDKAVSPINTYGRSKALMESLMSQANAFRGKSFKTLFSCVRYGNVAGSRGSVLPLFEEQIKEGRPLSITSMEMTRFWILLSQGVQFVIDSIGRMKGGEVFVPKIPTAGIMDIAAAVVSNHFGKPLSSYPHVVTGIRPGEKIHEVLVSENESYHTKEHKNFFCVEPEHPFWQVKTDGKPLPEGFSYTSLNNPWKLSAEEIRKMIWNF